MIIDAALLSTKRPSDFSLTEETSQIRRRLRAALFPIDPIPRWSPANRTSQAFHAGIGFGMSPAKPDYDGPGLDRVAFTLPLDR